MSAPDFPDANLLVYAYGPADSSRRRQARDLLRGAFRGELVWSARVLAEFAATLIVAAAERGGRERILAEDFNPGQTYFGATVENPFRL